MKKVLVFGTFDGLHEGHRFFLCEAKKHGDYLVVAVAQDETVQKLKHKLVRKKLETRIADLQKETCADEVVPGDKKLGSWEVVKNHRPDIIALGYDQIKIKNALAKELSKFDWHIEIIIVPPFGPDTFHSSILSARQ